MLDIFLLQQLSTFLAAGPVAGMSLLLCSEVYGFWNGKVAASEGLTSVYGMGPVVWAELLDLFLLRICSQQQYPSHA